MTYIKTTNIVEVTEPVGFIKTVRCPYCLVFLKPVPSYVTVMKCWRCNKEFRIEQDEEKWESAYSDPMHTVTRTIM